MASGSLLALLIIVIVSLLIVRIGTNALVLTGMSLDASRFQAASAFFGVGFTTSEAEMVVGHVVRRKIILHLNQCWAAVITVAIETPSMLLRNGTSIRCTANATCNRLQLRAT